MPVLRTLICLLALVTLPVVLLCVAAVMYGQQRDTLLLVYKEHVGAFGRQQDVWLMDMTTQQSIPLWQDSDIVRDGQRPLFAPDYSRFMTDTCEIIDSYTGRVLQSYGKAACRFSIAPSDDKILVDFATADTRFLRLINWEGQQLAEDVPHPFGNMTSIKWSPDERHAIVGLYNMGEAGHLDIYAAQLYPTGGLLSAYSRTRWSEDSTLVTLVSPSETRKLDFYQVTTQQSLSLDTDVDVSGGNTYIEWLEDNNFLFKDYATNGNMIHLFGDGARNPLWTIGPVDDIFIHPLSDSPDKRVLIVRDHTINSVSIINVRTGETIREVYEGPNLAYMPRIFNGAQHRYVTVFSYHEAFEHHYDLLTDDVIRYQWPEGCDQITTSRVIGADYGICWVGDSPATALIFNRTNGEISSRGDALENQLAEGTEGLYRVNDVTQWLPDGIHFYINGDRAYVFSTLDGTVHQVAPQRTQNDRFRLIPDGTDQHYMLVSHDEDWIGTFYVLDLDGYQLYPLVRGFGAISSDIGFLP